MFTRKDRKIANLKAMVKNRDVLIKTLERELMEALIANNEHQTLNGHLQTRITELEKNIEVLKGINKIVNT